MNTTHPNTTRQTIPNVNTNVNTSTNRRYNNGELTGLYSMLCVISAIFLIFGTLHVVFGYCFKGPIVCNEYDYGPYNLEVVISGQKTIDYKVGVITMNDILYINGGHYLSLVLLAFLIICFKSPVCICFVPLICISKFIFTAIGLHFILKCYTPCSYNLGWGFGRHISFISGEDLSKAILGMHVVDIIFTPCLILLLAASKDFMELVMKDKF